MDTKIISKLFNDWYMKPKSIFLLLLPVVSIFLATYPFEKEISFAHWAGLYSLYFLLFMVVVCYVREIFRTNSIPRAKKGTIGILFIVNSENIKQFDDIKNKLINKFDEYLKKNSTQNFTILQTQGDKIINYDFFDAKSLKELLLRSRCKFAVKVSVLSERVKDESKYQLTINNGIALQEFIDDNQKGLESEFKLINQFIGKLQYLGSNKIEKLEFTAEQLSLIFRYILAIVLCCEDHNINSSEQLFEELYIEIKNIKKNVPVYNYLKIAVPIRCHQIHMIKGFTVYLEYKKNKKNVEKIREYGVLLEEANSYYPNTYQYFLSMSVYYVCAEMNIEESKKCIEKCKKINADGVWRYNAAFIYAFEENGFLTIYKMYTAAFKEPFDLNELILFIEDMVSHYPNNEGLYFALGMIYSQLKDFGAARKNFDRFYVNYNGNDKSQLHEMINKRMGN